jgi:prevent-host-death family protein
MKSVTADEAKRRFGEMLKLADSAPVEITRHGRRCVYVLMSAQVFNDYELIRRAQSEERMLVTVQNEIGKPLKNGEQGFLRVRIGNRVMERFREAAGRKP